MNIAFIGAGRVGAPLALHLVARDHQVTLAQASEGSESIQRARARDERIRVAEPKAAVAAADVVFLATPFQANEAAVKGVQAELVGKILVDCTNPVGPGLSHGLASAKSGSQLLAEWLPATHVVKAFTIYGFENFEDPVYPGYAIKPAMLFCGSDAGAKQSVAKLITDVGFEPVDVGGLEQALHLEHMTLMWVRMVRAHGQSPNLVWAALRR